jgi:hypothetical protein
MVASGWIAAAISSFGTIVTNVLTWIATAITTFSTRINAVQIWSTQRITAALNGIEARLAEQVNALNRIEAAMH